MPYQPIQYNYSGISELLPNAIKGYQASQLPQQMQQERQSKLLQDQLVKAQIAEANRKAQMPQLQSTFGKTIYDMLNMEGTGMVRPGTAENYSDKYSKLAPGMQFTMGPDGQFSLSTGGSVQGAPGIKGSVPITSETGETIGYNIPLTADEIKEERGRSFFNNIQPKIVSGLKPYSGKGSNIRFHEDASAYGKDPEATQRIDDFLVAQNALTTAGIKELSGLGGRQTVAGINAIKKSMDISDVMPLLERTDKGFLLPQEAFGKSQDSFRNWLNTGQEASIRNLPMYRQSYLPGKEPNQKENKPSQNMTSAQRKGQAPTYSEEDIMFTAKKNGISPDKVREKLREKYGS